jgi:hypothetical protein
MKFVLELDFGNDAMSCGWDVARALKNVASDVNSDVELTGYATIRDLNGNTVGKWEVVNEKK